MIATYFGFPEVVQVLLEHGANTQNQNVRGETARDILCHKTAEAAKHMQCKKLIREHEEKQQKLAKDDKLKEQQRKQPTKGDVDADALRRRERELDEKERNLADKEKAAAGAAGLCCCLARSRVSVLFSFFCFWFVVAIEFTLLFLLADHTALLHQILKETRRAGDHAAEAVEYVCSLVFLLLLFVVVLSVLLHLLVIRILCKPFDSQTFFACDGVCGETNDFCVILKRSMSADAIFCVFCQGLVKIFCFPIGHCAAAIFCPNFY